MAARRKSTPVASPPAPALPEPPGLPIPFDPPQATPALRSGYPRISVLADLHAKRHGGPTYRSVRTDTYTVKQYVQLCLQGLMYLPSFQREFVWTNEQILDLLDSLLQGFPLGSFFAWQDHRLASGLPVAIGGVPCGVTGRTGYGTLYLLDGQQRTGALLRAFARPGFAFDFRTDRFMAYDPTTPLDLWQMPLTVLSGGYREKNTWGELAGPEYMEARLHGLFYLEEMYHGRMLTVNRCDGTWTGAAMRELFRRINLMGTPIDETQMDALLLSADPHEGA